MKTANKDRSMHGALLLVLVLTFGLGACDLDELLEVDLPGEITTEALDDPRKASLLLTSVINETECAWSNYVAGASLHSDEWMGSSANPQLKRMGQRDITAGFPEYGTSSCGSLVGQWRGMHTARVQARDQAALIRGFSEAAVANKNEILAKMRGYHGYTFIAFAEGFCGTPLEPGGPVLSSQELFQRAEEVFTETIQLAGQEGLESFRNMALVGQARARLGLQDYVGVISVAEQVPAGFRFDATRDESDSRRENRIRATLNGFPEDHQSRRAGVVAPSYRDVEWKGEDDPRVVAVTDGQATAYDFSTVHWRTPKINSFSTPDRMASYEEAQMFIAEASAFTGDLDRARQILNDFHTKAGIPPVTAADIATQDDVIRHVIEERRREFYVEGGHRLLDHLRWRGTQFEVPFLGEPGSDHPNGLAQDGAPYGNATCFPVPINETT